MINWSGVVGVAQLVERRSVAPDVAGSIPVSHPNPTLCLIPALQYIDIILCESLVCGEQHHTFRAGLRN